MTRGRKSQNPKPVSGPSSPVPNRMGGSSSAAPSSSQRAPTTSSGPPTSNAPPVPPGVCFSFWNSGKCAREFNCRFRHIPNPSLANESPATSDVSLDTAPFLNKDGLTKLNGIGTDVFFPPNTLSPGDAHNNLKRFLYDDYRFRSTFDVYAFVSILTSATSFNPAWNQEDGQLLLSNVATGNGILRIGDVIRWAPVSTTAGSDRITLSFQRGFLPLLRYMSSDFVVRSTLSSLINALYMRIVDDFDDFAQTIEQSMAQIVSARSFKDPKSSNSKPIYGSQVLASLAGVLFECLTRFKNIVAQHPRLVLLAQKLRDWHKIWLDGISANPPTFDESFNGVAPESRDHIASFLKTKIDRVVAIADREQAKLDQTSRREDLRASKKLSKATNEGILTVLRRMYEGPGTDRPSGPRHDNDFVEINNIRIAPTHEELICRIQPSLPANIYEAPHSLPAESMERLLDIQFRLLREELTAPLRTSVQLVRDDLLSNKKKTRLADIITKSGGKYRGHADGQDGVMFNVYTNVVFSSLVPDRRGITTSLLIDSPPGRARAGKGKDRVTFWESMSGKRLMQGGLVALLWKRGADVDVHMGILASSSRDLAESARRTADQVSIRVIFFDSTVELRILEALKRPEIERNSTKVLIESPVMFEAIRPFLEALQAEPESIPFQKYLVHRPSGTFLVEKINPPAYTKVPGFKYQLASLFPPEARIRDLKLTTTDAASVQRARNELQRSSRLDKSQATAVVDALSRELSLIQGPPGTGKSYTGVEIIRVLLENKVKPILLIAFTNHALDHMLCSILDAKITTSIVRLGSRSADEKISQYSLETLEKVAGQSRLDRAFGRNYRMLKEVEEEIKKLMSQFLKLSVESHQIMQFLEFQYPEHYEYIIEPPSWISAIKKTSDNDESNNGEWEQADKKGKGKTEGDNSMYAFWKDCQDLNFLQATAYEQHVNQLATPDSPPQQVSDTQHDTGLQLSDFENPGEFFMAFGLESIPQPSELDRPLDELLAEGDMWSMSPSERHRVHTFWNERVRETAHITQLEEFERLRERHADTLRKYNEGKDEIRRQLLKDVDIVGCTTTGAAKLTALLKGLSPRVMLVEEAGQVLEAHVLGSLVPTIEHLILIGDPLQLRPTINNYALSVENRRGGELYKFDMSLMERLSRAGLAMSQIDVQRRMRPTISNLIRRTLYPRLEDHDRVKQYPHVKGLAKDVFFLNHSNKENGGMEESASKYNEFEVAMIKDLVLYLLRQGPYTKEGDIVVLCAYLGQLARVRDALSSEVAVVIDEVDQMALADQEDEDSLGSGLGVERVKVSKRVRLRTVDNYQGEEATIVILSLVRNSGSLEETDGRTNIGFLRSENRANVALSRAREGLFILGNATNLASRSDMWQSVIDELEKDGALGEAFPVVCHRHPEKIEYVGKPGVLPRIAPDGGCLRACDTLLPCGHLCPHKCHPDDPNHIAVTCPQPCRRLCPRGHPCDKQCADSCGNCEFPISNVLLPCGHTKSSVPCYIIDSLDEVICDEMVLKALATCEHTAYLKCSDDPSRHICLAPCMGTMPCCGRDCNSRCHQCQTANTNIGSGAIKRKNHHPHRCGKTLYCDHGCQNNCSQDHECTTICKAPCRQQCVHSKCKNDCSTPCAPCQEPCVWVCAHHVCPVPCGSVCARLPCDKHCEKVLECGHRCPSVCGEDCSIQVCPVCADPDLKANVVDFIMQRTLEDIAVDQDTLDELLITIPNCGHFFTVETLDGHCGMMEYYTREGDDGKWLELKAPPIEFKKPPTCPTCRTAITSPRYGRIFKPANLAILERNVASQMSRSLHQAQTTFEVVSKERLETALKTLAANIKVENSVPDSQESRDRNRTRILRETRDQPTPAKAMDPGDKDFHGASTFSTIPWKSAIAALIRAYVQTMAVASTRSAHVRAWQSAFSCLYEQETHMAISDPGRAPRRPREHAMRMARMKVGQPQPLADKRFLVEAFWTSLNIRFTLAELGQVWLTALFQRDTAYPADDRDIWVTFVEFVLDTCIRDAHMALDIANESDSHRQVLRSAIFVLRANLERTRLEGEVSRHKRTFLADRDNLIANITQQAENANTFMQSILQANHRLRRTKPEAKQQWRQIGDEFSSTARAILKEYSHLERCTRQDTFYEPVSLDEKTAIVKALGFSHTGHFYNCPNGHTFVIGECGGATQQARCPDCGETIGGTDHTLLGSNTRNTELEALARESGAQRSPWTWGV